MAFATLDNRPATEQELCKVYPGDMKTLREDIRNYGFACQRHSVGGHFEGRSGCELSGMHRVCSISINKRQRLLWLEHDFADEALEKESTAHFDPIEMAAERRDALFRKRTRHAI